MEKRCVINEYEDLKRIEERESFLPNFEPCEDKNND